MKQKDKFGVLELCAYCIGYILLITIYRFFRTNEFDVIGFLKITATIFVVASATFAIFNKGSFKKTSSDCKLPMIMITAVVPVLVSVFVLQKNEGLNIGNPIFKPFLNSEDKLVVIMNCLNRKSRFSQEISRS